MFLQYYLLKEFKNYVYFDISHFLAASWYSSAESPMYVS